MEKLRLTLQMQINANRTYFYPACEVSHHLLELMKRKALVSKDRPALERFIRSMDREPVLEILQPEAPTF